MIVSFILSFIALATCFVLGSYLTFKSIQKAKLKDYIIWLKTFLKKK